MTQTRREFLKGTSKNTHAVSCLRHYRHQSPPETAPMLCQCHPGLFDLEARAVKLTALGDPLVTLNAEIDFEAFRTDLVRVHEKPRKSNAGAKPFDVVLMFRVLILQHLYNLSDDGIDYQIRDRLSFMRFPGVHLEARVPDAKTVRLFRERLLKPLGWVDMLFARVDEQLAQRGYVAKAGQMIDATPSTGSGQALSKPRASGIPGKKTPRSKRVRFPKVGMTPGRPPSAGKKTWTPAGPKRLTSPTLAPKTPSMPMPRPH